MAFTSIVSQHITDIQPNAIDTHISSYVTLLVWCKRIDIVHSCWEREVHFHALDALAKARTTLELRGYYACLVSDTPALRRFFATLAPRLFWTCSKFVHALHAHGDCTAIAIRSNCASTAFYTFPPRSTTWWERSAIGVWCDGGIRPQRSAQQRKTAGTSLEESLIQIYFVWKLSATKL